MPIESYLETVVLPILYHPESFKVSKSIDQMGVLLSITVHKEDMGLLIGKGGETSKAVRALVRLVGIKNQQRVSIKITEPDGSFNKKPLSEAVL